MINQSNIFKKIGYILNELQDQYQFLSENPEQLSELELELFLANANFLSDHVEIVKKLNDNKTPKELPQFVEISKDDIVQPIQQSEPVLQEEEILPEVAPVPEPVSNHEPLIEEIEREELQQEDLPPAFEFVIDESPVSNRFDFEERSVVDMFDRTLSEEEEQIIAAKQRLADSFQMPAQPTAEENKPIQFEEAKAELEPMQTNFVAYAPELKEVPAPSVEFVIDKVERKEVQQLDFNAPSHVAEPTPQQPRPVESIQPVQNSMPLGMRPTLNDLLAGKNSSSHLAEESARPTITDLKRSITLNEKLLYIKDLFNGYNLAYSEAIDLINKMPDFRTADAFLKNNYAVKNNWDAKQGTVEQFYQLLKQRFPED